jgi:hypothetical protein
VEKGVNKSANKKYNDRKRIDDETFWLLGRSNQSNK